MKPTIAIGADHAGYELKEALKETITSQGYEILDLGTNSTASVDYPEFGKAVADAVASNKAKFGVVVCGSGIGISIAANRNPAIRAALCTTTQMAQLGRMHNDANVLALGARLTDIPTAKACLKAFLTTEFEGGRHQKRVEQLGSCTTH